MVKGLLIILIIRDNQILLSQILPTHSSLASICHSTPDSLHRSITLTLIPPRPMYHRLPVVSGGKAASGRSRVSGRQTVAHSQARPHQRIGSYHWRPGTSLTGTTKQKQRNTWNRRAVGADTDLSPPAGVKRCCVAGPYRPHPLSCRVTGSSTWNDTRASLLCCRITFSGSPLILTKETS